MRFPAVSERKKKKFKSFKKKAPIKFQYNTSQACTREKMMECKNRKEKKLRRVAFFFFSLVSLSFSTKFLIFSSRNCDLIYIPIVFHVYIYIHRYFHRFSFSIHLFHRLEYIGRSYQNRRIVYWILFFFVLDTSFESRYSISCMTHRPNYMKSLLIVQAVTRNYVSSLFLITRINVHLSCI